MQTTKRTSNLRIRRSVAVLALTFATAAPVIAATAAPASAGMLCRTRYGC
jgi:hypothetical protein